MTWRGDIAVLSAAILVGFASVTGILATVFLVEDAGLLGAVWVAAPLLAAFAVIVDAALWEPARLDVPNGTDVDQPGQEVRE